MTGIVACAQFMSITRSHQGVANYGFLAAMAAFLQVTSSHPITFVVRRCLHAQRQYGSWPSMVSTCLWRDLSDRALSFMTCHVSTLQSHAHHTLLLRAGDPRSDNARQRQSHEQAAPPTPGAPAGAPSPRWHSSQKGLQARFPPMVYREP